MVPHSTVFKQVVPIGTTEENVMTAATTMRVREHDAATGRGMHLGVVSAVMLRGL